MTTPIEVQQLPGTERARKFEGKHHGATVSFFVGAFEPGDGPKLHRHPYEETFVLDSGSATFTVDGQTINAVGGQIVVVPAGAAHKFVVTGDRTLRQVSIHSAPEMHQEWVEESG
jgi:quercetin dioxygenase-like cupin family protein